MAVSYFDPTERRDSHGRWTESGGGESKAKPPVIKKGKRLAFSQGTQWGTDRSGELDPKKKTPITDFTGTVERKSKDGRLLINAGTQSKPVWVTTREEHASEIGSEEGPSVGRTDWSKKLTEDEYDAVLAYKGADYAAINDGLRGSSKVNPELRAKALSKKNAAQVAALDSAIQKGALEKDTTVYRGFGRRLLGLNGRDPKSLVGEAFTDHGYVSTSEGKSIAEAFAKQSRSGPVLARIKLPKGAPVAFPDTIDKEIKERELLLGRDTPFVITKVSESRDGLITIDMEPVV